MKLLFFSGEWCAPCKAMHATMQKIVADHPDIEVTYLDVIKNQDLACTYKVMSVPTIIVMDDDPNEKWPKNEIIGARSENDLLKELEIC